MSRVGEDEMEEVDRRVRRALEQLGVVYEMVPCDPALSDTAAFCAAYGYEIADSANTIMVHGKADPPRFVACVVLATTRLEVNRVVRHRLGVQRASFADAATTVELTGMEIGGVTAVGLPPGLPLWVDQRVMGRDRIILGGGSRRFKLVVPPSCLSLVPHVEVIEGLARAAPDD
jgi:prolyl-tRNA editing enzyme YbaK/EbsC (Cys-tRNA(Pro) deacylase)